jgi:hypothetical protein
MPVTSTGMTVKVGLFTPWYNKPSSARLRRIVPISNVLAGTRPAAPDNHLQRPGKVG